MPVARRSSSRRSTATPLADLPVATDTVSAGPQGNDSAEGDARSTGETRELNAGRTAAEAIAVEALATFTDPLIIEKPPSRRNSAVSQSSVATPTLFRPAPRGPFGPVTAGPAMTGPTHRRTSTASPFVRAKSSSSSDAASSATTEELMDVDEKAADVDQRQNGESAEPEPGQSTDGQPQFAIGIAEGRKSRKRSQDAETVRKIAESLSPVSKKDVALPTAPQRRPPARARLVPEILVHSRQRASHPRRSLYAEQSSDSSGAEDEVLLLNGRRATSETSSSRSSAQLSKRLLNPEVDMRGDEEATSSPKRVKGGHAPQNSTCQHPNFREAKACPECAAGRPSDCSYKGVRSFMSKSDDRGTRPDTESPLFPSTRDKPISAQPEYPTQYRSRFTQSHAEEIKTEVAYALESAIAVEEEHARRPGCFEITIPLAERSICDGCLTTIFLGSWICSRCRIELCLDCGVELERLHQAGNDRDNPRHAARLQRCLDRTHGGVRLGDQTEFAPQSKMSKGELGRIKNEMARRRQEHPATTPLALDQDVLDYVYSPKQGYHSSDDISHRYIHLGPGIFDEEPSTSPAHHGASRSRPSPRPPAAGLDPVVAKLASIDRQTLFASLWSRGEPMVVDVDLTKHLEKEWSPRRFVAEFGDQLCTIASNTGQAERRGVTVREYFELQPVAEQSWKIKDYPPASTFKEQLPALYEDFIDSVPFPEITCPHGPRNLAAHAPLNSTPPDLGPKGYWSQTSNDFIDGKGSTMLHMVCSDLADAVNLMLWSADKADGSPGLAAWDIFRAEDSNKIRDFIHELKAEQHGEKDLALWRQSNDDPIHVQDTFLNSDLRAQLLEKKGVKSFRIWQRPGQVVFIPAGCAHQVCNFADCIKVASDFVSKENVQRCWKVTDEFRGITKGEDLWREDVLQLKSQLLWAWRSCERFDRI